MAGEDAASRAVESEQRRRDRAHWWLLLLLTLGCSWVFCCCWRRLARWRAERRQGRLHGSPTAPSEKANAELRSSSRNSSQGRRERPQRPRAQQVRLFDIKGMPCSRRLQVLSYDQAGLLFKLCDFLAQRGININSADITTEFGVVSNQLELRASSLSTFTDNLDLCEEIEDLLAGNGNVAKTSVEYSLAAEAKKLCTDTEMLQIMSFVQTDVLPGPPEELRFTLELAGISEGALIC